MSQVTGFSSLKPALMVKMRLGNVNALGTRDSGPTLTHFELPTGTITTIPGFEPAFKAKVVFGADWLSVDPDGKRARVDVRGIAVTEDGKAINYTMGGVLEITPGVAKIMQGDPTMATTPFGAHTGWIKCQAADPALKFLENATFVGNSRFVVDQDGVHAESRQSLVVASTEMD